MTEQKNKRNRPYEMAALALVTLVLLFVSLRRTPLDFTQAPVVSKDTIDSYIIKVSSHKYGETGKLKQSLQADYAAHHKHSDESELTAPLIINRTDTGRTWHTTAETGKVHAGGHIIELQENVTIKQIASDTVLRTTRITYDSDTNEAYTDDLVKITANQWRTEGTGMTANLDKDKVKLHNDVTSVYKPAL